MQIVKVNPKIKFIVAIVFFFILFVLLQIAFFITRIEVNRSKSSLMNQYFKLKDADPLAARRTLELIIEKNPTDQAAIRELAFWALKNGDIRLALEKMEYAYRNDPTDLQNALDLGKLYMTIGNNTKARMMLTMAGRSDNLELASEAQMLLAQVPAAKLSMPTPVEIAPEKIVENSSQVASAPAINEQTPEALVNAVMTTKENANSMPLTLIHNIPIASQANAVSTNGVAAPAISTISKRDQLMNDYYNTKKTNPQLAWIKLQKIIALYPHDVMALKEAGYYTLLQLKDNASSLSYFSRVYEITRDPEIALQIAYIYENLRQNRRAYHYFDLATNTSNPSNRMTAELAKTSLRGVQTKFLPDPYYASLDFSPLYMSRFKLMIYPVIFRFGKLLNETYQWRVYLGYRRTSDNKSTTTNIISNIYQDNYILTSLGTSFVPFPRMIPQLLAFGEAGKSQDLVYRNRARWRSDIRYGLAYYNEWGRPPTYTLSPTIPLKFNGDVYSDAIYYNRYHDGIFTFRVRPGFEIFRYGSSSIKLYYRTFVVEDQARQFYNNIIETGPGIAFTPSDRYNIILRRDVVHGRYLPASSPTANPYSKNYYDSNTELDTYFEF